MNQFKAENFKFVTIEGMARLYKTLDSYGTCGVLYEISNRDMVDLLMGSSDFCITEYLDENYAGEEAEVRDELLNSFHDELVDAVTMISYAFCHTLDEMKTTDRSMHFISSLLEVPCEEMNSLIMTIDELGNHCADVCHKYPVFVMVIATGEGCCAQQLSFAIAGVEEFEVFETLYNSLCGIYSDVTIFKK